jgi:hypothetical protein
MALTLADQQTEVRIDGPHAGLLAPFTLARHRLAVAAAYADDQQAIEGRWSELAAHFDLTEPFTRIREALLEAQKGR